MHRVPTAWLFRMDPRRIGIFYRPVPKARRGAAAHTFLSWPYPVAALSDVSNFLLALLKKLSTESVIRDSLSCTRKRDEPQRRIAEWNGRKRDVWAKEYERKKSTENGWRGVGAEETRGRRRRRRRRKASASNADIRHTTSNAGAARWKLDRPTLKTPVDQPWRAVWEGIAKKSGKIKGGSKTARPSNIVHNFVAAILLFALLS